MAKISIAIDAMGGDHGVSVTVPAACDILSKHNGLKLVLVGDEKIISTALKASKYASDDRISIQHATEVVGMDEPPAQALRFKKDSSMRVAINLVKQGVVDACVSAGNTGALMATARFVLKTLPGIDRPAICSSMPTMRNTAVRILDLGANVDSTAEQLFQFAVMGSVLASSVSKLKNPKVGLLNIGSEEIKGNEQVKKTAKLLNENKHINYIGYVEGDDIYKGIVDVIVCDGFVGNVTLKSSEGMARMISQYIKNAFTRSLITKTISIVAFPVLNSLAKQLDPARYNGATFVGLKGTVIKSHGGANILGFAHAIEEAINEVAYNVPENIQAEVSRILQEEGSTS